MCVLSTKSGLGNQSTGWCQDCTSFEDSLREGGGALSTLEKPLTFEKLIGHFHTLGHISGQQSLSQVWISWVPIVLLLLGLPSTCIKDFDSLLPRKWLPSWGRLQSPSDRSLPDRKDRSLPGGGHFGGGCFKPTH